MATEQKVLTRIDVLLEKGASVLATHTPNPPGVIGFPTLDTDRFSEWRSQSISMLTSMLGADHSYTTDFVKNVESGYTGHAKYGLGILRALRDDIENGYLQRFKDLVLAEVFSDFIDMASHLLEAGYKDPAASLCGAVLENGLRDIAQREGVTVKSKDDLSALNQKLAQAGVYSRLVQKRLEVWTAIRNHADHGQFSEYAHDDVKDVLDGVSEFLGNHLG